MLRHVTLRYVTLHYIALHYIHACMHAYIHTYIHTYLHVCITHTHIYIFMHVCIYVNIHTCVQVEPGQAGGGSFKFEALIAYRAEQRLCL